jgi:hypothetical protein
VLAVQMLALGSPALARALARHKQALRRKVGKGNRKVQAELRVLTEGVP